MTLIGQLNVLESSGLIRLAQMQPELEYLFRHALIQDAAYGSLVKYDRKRLHLAVGEALELIYPDRQEELAPLLAQHFDEAGDDQRALKYFTQAADSAVRVYASAEAAALYARALEVAQRASHAQNGQIQQLYLKRGQALHSSARWDEAWANYIAMEDVAHARGDRSLELASLIERATLCAVYGPLLDPAQAESLSDQALALARELDDRAAEARVLWVLMRASVQAGGEPRQAVAYGERSLALARELGASEQLAYTLNDLQYAYRSAGQIDRALAALAEARDLWRANGNQHMLADNLNQAALITLYLGDFESALALTDEAFHISQASRNITQQALCRLIVGQIYLERGEIDRSIQSLEEGLQFGSPVADGIGSVLGSVYASLGDTDRAIELTQTALAAIEDTPLIAVFGPGTLGALARLWLLKGNLDTAEALIHHARQIVGSKASLESLLGAEEMWLAEGELAFARRDYAGAVGVLDEFLARLQSLGIREPAMQALYLKGKVRLAQRDVDEAYEILEAARIEAESIGARSVLWPILAALSQLEAQRGNRDEAESLRRQARKIIEYIADHAGALELRESFLNLPDVRNVIT